MNMRTLLTVNAVLAAVHGIGYVLTPNVLMNFYQVAPSPAVAFSGQLFGTELLFVAIVCWKARDFVSLPALQAIALAGVVANAVGAVVCTLAITGGVMGATGWLGVLIYVALALGYLWVMSRKAYGAAGAGAA